MKIEDVTINEYTDLLMDKFGLDKDERNKRKIRTKVVRTLKDYNYWDNLKDIDKGKLKVKVLNTYQQDTIFGLLQKYMVKQAHKSDESSSYNKNYTSKMNDFLSVKDESYSLDKKLLFKYLFDNLSDNVTDMMEIKAMVKAIFNIFYEELDLDRWQKDLLIRKYVEDRSIRDEVEERLSKPEKYYTKKRDKYDF